MPLLGQIPLDTTIRQGGDIGHPIVVAAPDSPSATAFRAAAHQAAAKLSMEAVKKPRRATIMLKPKPRM